MRFMLTFLRHGETDWNAQLKCQGQADIPLNKEGLDQAKAVATYLANEKFDYVFSSDLSRSFQTVQKVVELGPNPKLEIVKDKRLRERSFGVYEGMSFDIYQHALQNCVGEFVVEGGETAPQALQRFIDFLNDMCKSVKTQETNKVNSAKSSEGEASGASNTASNPAGGATSKVFVSEFTGEDKAARILPHVLVSTHGFMIRGFLKYLHCAVNVEIPEGDWLIDDGCPNTSLSTLVVETDKDDKFDFERLICYFIYKVDHFS
ncbi:fructose-2,6-bisphosphatase TIGAR-like [Lytechinus pictus]|uniref:fructose-2,6-bisphosphatase TIGAR-like n=1 Tax=Lytechinus pictus TaxID=7653 RepID=UPI0030BA019F